MIEPNMIFFEFFLSLLSRFFIFKQKNIQRKGLKSKCIETNQIFLVLRFDIFLWASKAFSRPCNAIYCIEISRKMLLVAAELS